MRLKTGTFAIAIALTMAVGAAPAMAGSSGHANKHKVFVVCKHGCKYRTIFAAVDAVKKGEGSVIKIRPGTYHEGVSLIGHRYDGIAFVGASKNPRKQVLEGRNAKLNGDGHEQAQNGINTTNVDGVKIKNLWARHFQSNGFFVNSDKGTTNCRGFLMKNDLASFNRSYGLFAKRCIGGRITQSKGWGHGDSAIYIGETPPQTNPKWTQIDHDKAFENVLGYSGTNSKYVNIHDSEFFNNGAGIVPNTLDSERFQPNATGKIQRQRRLLEQLQLLPAALAGEDRLRRPRPDRGPDDQLPDGRRGDPVRLRRLGRQAQPDLRQLQVGSGELLGSVQHRGGEQEQPARRQRSWDEAAPTRTSSTSSTTARARATASRATRRRPSSARPTPNTRTPSCIRAVPHPPPREPAQTSVTRTTTTRSAARWAFSQATC